MKSQHTTSGTNRRSFLTSLLLAPKVLQRLAKPKIIEKIQVDIPEPHGWHYAEFKYHIYDHPAIYDEAIFHLREK